MANSSGKVCIVTLDDAKNVWRDTIRQNDAPEAVTVNAVKCLFEVDEVDVQTSLPFSALLNDVPKGEYVVNTTSSFSKASLLLAKVYINRIDYPLVDDFAKDLTRYRQ